MRRNIEARWSSTGPCGRQRCWRTPCLVKPEGLFCNAPACSRQPCGNAPGDGTGNVAFRCVTVCQAHWFEVPRLLHRSYSDFQAELEFLASFLPNCKLSFFNFFQPEAVVGSPPNSGWSSVALPRL